MTVNRYQTRASAGICAERAERFAELSPREQLRIESRARELRAENARRAARAMN